MTLKSHATGASKTSRFRSICKIRTSGVQVDGAVNKRKLFNRKNGGLKRKFWVAAMDGAVNQRNLSTGEICNRTAATWAGEPTSIGA